MHKLYELKDKLLDELEGYAENGKFSKEDVEVIKYMASAVDHICNIVDGKEEAEYSGYMMPGSYARGRMNARRDAMGRYSRAGAEVADELRRLMPEVSDPHARTEMERLVSRLDRL